MSEPELPPCPSCQSIYTYLDRGLLTCPECGHEWSAEAEPPAEAGDAERVVKDANGNVLQDGDDVAVIKTLKVKGAAAPIKAGTKVRNIRLVDGDHDIDCRIEGFGAMQLKSQFVKKV